MSRTLLLRTLSAALAIPVVLALLWFGGWVIFGGACIFLGLATHEYVRMAYRKTVRPIWLVCLASSILLCAAAAWPPMRPWAASGVVVCMVGAFAWRGILPGARSGADLIATLAMPLYVGGAFACMLSIRGSEVPHASLHPVSVSLPAGLWWMLVILFGTWSFDIGAYLIGRKLGRHKMAPSISPKKSWEGVAGGLLFAVPIAVWVTRPLHITLLSAIAGATAIAAAAILGDLAESLFKRWAGVKDSGHFLPGHGGLFDRIDSVMLVAFVVFVLRFLAGR